MGIGSYILRGTLGRGTGRRVVGPYGGRGGFMDLISWEKKAETFA